MWGALQYTAVSVIMLFHVYMHMYVRSDRLDVLALIELAGTLAVCSKKMRSSGSPAIKFLLNLAVVYSVCVLWPQLQQCCFEKPPLSSSYTWLG